MTPHRPLPLSRRLCPLLFALTLPLACSSPTAPAFSETEADLGPRDIQDERLPLPQEEQAGARIQAAIDAARPGDTVRLRAGHYRIESEILITRPLSLLGEPDTVLELAEGASSSVIAIVGRDGDHPITGVHLEGLRIIGNGHAQTAGSGVVLLRARDCSLRDMVITDCHTDGVYLSGASHCRIENLVLLRCGRNGLSFGEAIREPGSNNVIADCRSAGNGLHGFDGEPVSDTVFRRCESTDNSGDGFMLGAEERSSGNAIISCRAMFNGRNGCTVWSNENTLEDSTIRRNRRAGITVMGPIAADNLIQGCRVAMNGWHGILLDRASRATVQGNRIADNGLADRGDGIAAVSSIDVYGNRIIGNTIRGTSHRRALSVTQRVWQTVVLDNDIEGSVVLNGD